LAVVPPVPSVTLAPSFFHWYAVALLAATLKFTDEPEQIELLAVG
jgi:hypothetical protein